MKNFTEKRQEGFTLVELLVAMAIALVVIASIANAFVSQRKTYATQEQVSEMIQSARAAMDMIVREIKMAGYNPTGGTLVGIPYSTTQLEIRADLNGDGDVSDADETIIYSEDTANKILVRNAGGSAEPFAENVQSFTFGYYDKDGNTTTTAGDIRQIKVTITAMTGVPDPNYLHPTYSDGHRRYTLTSYATPQNLDL